MKTKDIVLVAASTFLIIIGAYIAVPIGPVPIVLTNFFIILIGLLFGWKKALLAVLTYLILGAIGLPVFSNGKAGIAHIIGLTGGFLVGFIPLAFLSGIASSKKNIFKVLLVVAGSILVYLMGLPWALYVFREKWDLATALKYTTYPFLIPDLIKIIAALLISNLLKPVLKPFISGRDE
ncbi:MAG: biotin transporter BioY [Spirochaetaceae bacterium]